MMPWSKQRPVCPGCKQPKKPEQTQQLGEKIQQYFAYAPDLVDFLFQSNPDKAYKYFTSTSDSWACDQCLEQGIAIEGDFTEQTFCIWQPHLAYVDQQKICRTCKCDFVFSKNEQKFWYEELKFWVVSDAVNCKNCRRDKRDRKTKIHQAQQEIAQLMPDFDRWNIEHLERLVHLYELTESQKKVAYYQQMLERLKQRK